MNTYYSNREESLSKQLYQMLFVFVLLLLSACGGNPHGQRGELVSQTELATIPAGTVSAIMNGYG